MIEQQLIVVLGMHRSGTSAVTRGLKVLGVELGDHLYQADSFNKKGYWEDIDLHALNAEMLTAIGNEWDYLTAPTDYDIEKLRNIGFLQRAKELLIKKVGSASMWGYKDPRIVKLLPFWQQVYSYSDFKVSYVLACRNPCSIAASLANRDGFEKEKSYLLTLQYWLNALRYVDLKDLHIVNYERLITDPESELSKLAQKLELDVISRELALFKSEFLDAGLQNHTHTSRDLSEDRAAHPLLGEVYGFISEISSNGASLDSELYRKRLNNWMTEFSRLGALCSLSDKLASKVVASDRALSEMEAKTNDLIIQHEEIEGIVATRDEHIDSLGLILENQLNQIGDLNDAIFQRDKQIEALGEHLSEQTRLTQELSRSILQCDKQANKLSIEIGKHAQRIDQLNETKARATKEIAKLETALTTKNREINEFEESVAKRDKQISDLDESIAERDKQISDLDESIAERDKQISDLDESIAERDQHILKLQAANSKYNNQVAYLQSQLERSESIVSQLNDAIEALENGIDAASDSVLETSRQHEIAVKHFMQSFHKLPSPSLKTTILRSARVFFNWLFVRRELSLISNSELFDRDFYLQSNPDVEAAGVDPGRHYLEHGWKESRDPSKRFSTSNYLFNNPDVLALGINPLSHYVRAGQAEGRIIAGSGASLLGYGDFDKSKYLPETKILTKEFQVEIEVDSQIDIMSLSPEERLRDEFDFDREEDRSTILFVDYASPMYDMFAGSRTNFMYLKLLVEMGLRVIFLPADFEQREPYTSEMKELGILTLGGEWFEHNWPKWLESHGDKIDFVFFNKADPTIKFIDAVEDFTDATIIYQCHDLHHLRLQRKAEVEQEKDFEIEAEYYKKIESYIFQKSDIGLTFSTVEEKIIEDSFPEKVVHTVPLYFYESVDRKHAPYDQSQDLLFVGSCAHTPNRDALHWFCNEVLPLVREQIPDMVLNVVGNNPPDDVLELQSENINILGGVSEDELNERYKHSRIAVVPLRYGAGVKGKTLEALYHGIPIVSTSIGLEGIENVGLFASPKDTPEDFAAELISIYQDEQSWTNRSEQGQSYVAEYLTSEKVAQQMERILFHKEDSADVLDLSEAPKLITFYLPQYHPIPENNQWWGTGFTEWQNVGKAEPIFPGHYQPHLPADLGFYDLRCEESRIAQAELAAEYGIHGFCFYHYWFNGKRLLERPVEEILASGKPDFPFCLCWANENWTRRWDGEDQHVLMKLEYSEEDDRAHIRDLFRFFKDKRYIRIDGKPLFLVYRTENIPDPARTAEVWREEARQHGIGEIYLMRVESIGKCNPAEIGFDAALEFAPDWWNKGIEFNQYPRQGGESEDELQRLDQFHRDNHVHSYDSLIETMMAKPAPNYQWLRCATPSWDNTARRKEGAHVFLNATPKKYQRWLEKLVSDAENRLAGDEKMVFINAWNEWAEGNHLEPDQRFGHRYLEATSSALRNGFKIAALKRKTR